MPRKNFELEVAIPEGVEVSVDNGVFTVKGDKGEVTRDLFHPRIDAKVENGNIVFHVENCTNRERKLVHTYRGHVKNLFKGASEGIKYKLQVCASHFPMDVNYNNNELQVENFIGERTPRTLEIPEGVDVKVDGDEIILEGVDKEKVGQTAGSIENLCKRRGYDRRVFQDGIYIIEKDGKELV